MYEAGDTVTETAIMAASLIEGETTLKFASANYQVQDICFFLELCGCKISGIGSTTIEIEGVKEINKNIELRLKRITTKAIRKNFIHYYSNGEKDLLQAGEVY
jgi:UDP-N-acetylglucosamine 1-carboxyvinyltransferase